MRRGWAIGVAVLVVLGALYVYVQRSRVPERDRLVGKWRLYTDQPWYWHIALREDGTGTMSSWNYGVKREDQPVEVIWSVDTEKRELSIRAVKATRYWRGELGGSYKFYQGGRKLLLDHTAGPNPGTLMYSRVE